MKRKSYTALEAASFLLEGSGLSACQIEFLSGALDEVAEWHERIGKTRNIACHECVDELMQMNSLHRGGIEPVVYALTGLSFSVSWRDNNGTRTFVIEHRDRRDMLPRADFDAIHDGVGWGSDGHRRALRDLVIAHS